MQITRKIFMPMVRKWNRTTKEYEVQSEAQNVLVTIDIDEIALTRQLGGSAWNNKSKRAKLGKGMLKATAKAVM